MRVEALADDVEVRFTLGSESFAFFREKGLCQSGRQPPLLDVLVKPDDVNV